VGTLSPGDGEKRGYPLPKSLTLNEVADYYPNFKLELN